MANWFGARGQQKGILIVSLFDEADHGHSDLMGMSTGCSLLIACLVFSGGIKVPGDIEHRGDVTGDTGDTIRMAVGTDSEGNFRGVT